MVYTATDREQIDELKKWWMDYGRAIVIAVVIGLVFGFGWRYWNRYQEAQENAASDMYQMLLQVASTQQLNPVMAYATQLQQKYGRTVYATMGSFMAARVAVLNQQYATASTQLSWIMDKGKNTAFKQVARIRDARVLLQMNEPQLAMQVISTVNDGHYQPLIDEVMGEIYLAQHNSKAAQVAFEKAQSGSQAAGLQNPFLTLRSSS